MSFCHNACMFYASCCKSMASSDHNLHMNQINEYIKQVQNPNNYNANLDKRKKTIIHIFLSNFVQKR